MSIGKQFRKVYRFWYENLVLTEAGQKFSTISHLTHHKLLSILTTIRADQSNSPSHRLNCHFELNVWLISKFDVFLGML